jgi:hypothetical protein
MGIVKTNIYFKWLVNVKMGLKALLKLTNFLKYLVSTAYSIYIYIYIRERERERERERAIPLGYINTAASFKKKLIV